jgi:L-rhamnose-H+ transport protein
MTTSTSAGVALAVLAGLLSGNCMLPSKFLRAWRWENMWAVFSLVSLILLPCGLALGLVHHLAQVYSSLSTGQLVAPIAFGMCWGVAQILFGISVDRLGLGLAYAIIVGMGAALGTLIPMLTLGRDALTHRTLTIVLLGIVLMASGIALTAWSGRLRDGAANPGGRRYRASILLAILCGLLAPMLNYSFAFGQDIAKQAVAAGNPPLLASYAVWPVGLAGGFVPNAAYALYLLWRRRSWTAFKQPSRDLLLSCTMAALWMGAFSVYGMSAALLGALGTSIGWGLFQIFMILAASLSGLLTGEWRNASISARATLALGMSLLIVATLFFTAANRS